MRAWFRLARGLAAFGLLAGCAHADFDLAAPPAETSYVAAFPTYAEFCALSQIKKKPGFGADIRGEIGGHAVFYLNGACRVDASYPVLRLCREDEPGGVGLSMNAHFANAKWVAVPGRRLFYDGGLPGGALDVAGYAAVQTEARRQGLYDGVRFHPEEFEAMPPGWTREAWKYEISVATDYAIGLGRGRYCARVPVNRAQLSAMVAFLNAENAPYRDGQVFRWSLFQDNCIHLAHNALAAAGLWAPWPTGRPLLAAMLDFPVPRNEFVNIMRRTADDRLLDPAALGHDPAARALLAFGALPVGPGALASAAAPMRPNAVYETDLKLIFYDEPVFGRYQTDFDAIFADPHVTDLAANRAWYAARYRQALARIGPGPDPEGGREEIRRALFMRLTEIVSQQ